MKDKLNTCRGVDVRARHCSQVFVDMGCLILFDFKGCEFQRVHPATRFTGGCPSLTPQDRSWVPTLGFLRVGLSFGLFSLSYARLTNSVMNLYPKGTCARSLH